MAQAANRCEDRKWDSGSQVVDVYSMRDCVVNVVQRRTVVALSTQGYSLTKGSILPS